MKKHLITLCFLGALSLMGCATTQTNTPEKKAHAEQAQKNGSYFGTGVGIGFASF